MEYNVSIIWDEEAQVWVATSEDVPGLTLESPSYDTLLSRLSSAIPELLKLNSLEANRVRVNYHTERHDTVYA